MMLPLHAVIQGPLKSLPTPGRRWPPDPNPDCAGFAIDNASAIATLGGTAVVSTWAGEDRAKCDQLAAHPAVSSLLETPDPGRPPDTNGEVPDNRLRQAVSTFQGLAELERRGVTGLVAKLRTDQTVPVPLVQRFVSDFFAGLDESVRDKTVFITGAHNSALYDIDDFLIVGSLSAMKRFFRGPSASGAVSQRHALGPRRSGSQASGVDGWPGARLASVALLSGAVVQLARGRLASNPS